MLLQYGQLPHLQSSYSGWSGYSQRPWSPGCKASSLTGLKHKIEDPPFRANLYLKLEGMRLPSLNEGVRKLRERNRWNFTVSQILKAVFSLNRNRGLKDDNRVFWQFSDNSLHGHSRTKKILDSMKDKLRGIIRPEEKKGALSTGGKGRN